MLKILPWFGIAMIAVCAGADAQSKAGAAAIPEMQAGKWKLLLTTKGRTKDEEMCGNPIDGMQREVQEYAANTKWGCTLTTSASGSRGVVIVYDCPSDRSPDGRPVAKGRWETSVVSPSPQAFRIEIKSTVSPGYVMEGTRIGNCERR